MAIASLEKPTTSALPRAIRRGLSRVDHRLRAVAVARGLGKAALLLSVVAAMAMALDVAFVLPMEIRWGIWAAWIGAGVIALLRGVVRPLVRRTTWHDLAAVAESGETTLGERLTSAVGLLRQRPHGSPVLIAALVDDATERVRSADLTRAISSRGALSSLFLGLAAVALVVVPAFVRPHPYSDLWKRLLAPWDGIDRIGRFQVDVQPGDKVMAVGSDLTVAATVHSRFGEATPQADAWLEWTTAAGSRGRVKMAADPTETASGPTFALTLPKLTESLSYRVVFGRDSSRLHHIKAVDAPEVVNMKAYIEPPPYTKRPGTPARDPLRLDAWEDSRITLEIEGNRSLKQVDLIWPRRETKGQSSTGEASPQTIPMMRRAGDGRAWTATVTATASGPFEFRLRDEFDLESLPDSRYRLTVRPDAPPTLAVATPSDLKETRPDDLLVVAIVAHDDVAVASAELHYTIERASGSNGPALGHETAALQGLGTPSARGEAAMSLKTLSLRPGDVISYRVRVADNRPAPRGPNVAWSATYGLTMIEHSESLLARQGSAEREAIRARLLAIRKTAQTNREATEKLRVDADAVRTGDGIWDDRRAKALDAAEASARGVSDQLQLLARDLDEHPTFQPLARPARQIAEGENEAARVTLEVARRAGDAKRPHELQRSGVRLDGVTARMDDVIRRFDELARRDDDRRRLRLLAEQQNELAGQVELAARVADHPAIDPLLAEQERLRRELDELLKNSPGLRAEALDAQARQADELAVRARALAGQQREEARRTANTDSRRSALTILADQERRLEDDARRLALAINEPLAQNGRGGVDVGALAATVEAIERAEIDQARDRSHDAENALNRLSREIEDARNDPKALARRLAQRQEALRNETAAAVREPRDHPPQTPEGKATLADRLKPLTARQEAIARLAAAIKPPREQKEVARQAAKASAQARDDLREPRPRQVEGHQTEARDALNRLADALPDPNQRRNRAREKLAQARSWSEEVARDLETHLRETAPKAGQPYDAGKAAADLAQRVTAPARRQREIAAALAAIDPDPRALPQRDRAARRALAVADALENLRQQAPKATPSETKPGEPRPLASWRVLGAFPIGGKDPFPTDKPVDLAAKYPDRKGRPATWKTAVPVDNQGAIDLGQIYSKDDRLAAFGYTEIPSPVARSAPMLIGSDDTLTVWLNGKTVYDYRGNRSYGPRTDRVDVALNKGINRILIKCGNTGGYWMYSVALSEDPARPQANALEEIALRGPSFERLREALPALQVASRASLDRLRQKLDGQKPADELADDLADDQRDRKASQSQNPPADPVTRAQVAADQRRLANALHNVDAPDAPVAKAEAIHRAEQAARVLEALEKGNQPADVHEALAQAASAAEFLAGRLNDRQSPRERAIALSRAQRAIGTPDAAEPAHQARLQHAIADELASLPAEGKGEAARTVAQAAEVAEQAARVDNAAPPHSAAIAKVRDDAARALDRLAGSLRDEPGSQGKPSAPANHVTQGPATAREEADAPEDPELGLKPAQVAEAAALARRQRHIREGLQAILSEGINSQRALRASSAAMGREVVELRERSRETSPRAQGPANAAADLLGRAAPEAMDHATDRLHGGRPGEALQAQRYAADLTEQAARHVEDIAASLRADRAGDAHGNSPGGLAAAQAAQREAGQHLSQAGTPSNVPAAASQAAVAAAAAMHKAAQGLRSASQATHDSSGSARQALSRTGASPRDSGALTSQPDTTDLSQLKAALRAKTGRAWGELPGHLRTEILQMSQGRYRDEYARLIELYFREIAADASTPGARP